MRNRKTIISSRGNILRWSSYPGKGCGTNIRYFVVGYERTHLGHPSRLAPMVIMEDLHSNPVNISSF